MSRKTGPMDEEMVRRLKRTGSPARASGAGSEELSSAGSSKALRVRALPQGTSERKAPRHSKKARAACAALWPNFQVRSGLSASAPGFFPAVEMADDRPSRYGLVLPMTVDAARPGAVAEQPAREPTKGCNPQEYDASEQR